jgi:N-acetylglucosaminyldiphosphoundecaprenol N-acetyl-beta-D-mannosaminyltransferase
MKLEICMKLSEHIVGVSFQSASLVRYVEECVSNLDKNTKPASIAFVNPHSVMTAKRDPEFADALRDCDLNAPDGVGIVIASKILGGRIRERVCGPDFFQAFCSKLNSERPGTRMFFLGATDSTLALLVERFQRDFPNLTVAGTLAPPFRPAFTPADDDAMIEAVNSSHADILWIGLGAPKQEKLAHRIRNRLNVKLIAPVGGVFDFYTGRVKLPPQWMQKAGLIWLYRFFQQPRRLLRRNLDSPLFLIHVLGQRLRQGRA